ncbi:hypothetical protein NLG97_g3647 [Lecanicillium saksenae]|uniref:Uncharacterized protein n=1 Tax=Lecanicillium saksenae TaxID=468837 RepID=A0ACC1R067_9HYPO|nr:hypothetical protein NLG97_g3647 [Lecanicillium saksenae]
MRYATIFTGMFIYGFIATALPLMMAERSISPEVIIRILSEAAITSRQAVDGGGYNTGVPGGEPFLESDVDAGGESVVGNDAVGVASGLTGQGGAGSSALNSQTQGSTTVFCSLFACASASQSDGQVSTTARGAHINATGPLIQVQGPLISIYASRKSMSNISNSTATQ